MTSHSYLARADNNLGYVEKKDVGDSWEFNIFLYGHIAADKNMMLIKMRANVDKNVQHHYESCGARLNVIRFWGMIASDITDDITIIWDDFGETLAEKQLLLIKIGSCW